MSGSIASYEQLVRQVEALKKENSHLRRELQDNSHHLSKLENETSDMKEVLKHLQDKLEQEARVMVSSGQTEVLEQLKGGWQRPGPSPRPIAPSPCLLSLPPPSPALQMDISSLYNLKCFLLGEMEKEEKEKGWYYTQLQNLSKRLDELPHVETFSMQMDLIRQQLEFEVQHIRALMEERFGTADEMVQRAQIRASRLEQIDKELMEAQDKVQQSEPQVPGLSSVLRSHRPLGGLALSPHPRAYHSLVPVNPCSSLQVEVVFWLLSMLATRDKEDMSRTLLAMSSSQESCLAMRKSGCLPLLIQILHDSDHEPGPPESPAGAKDARMRANAALHNIVFSQPDEGQAKKEMRVLHVLEQIRSYSETCWDWLQMQGHEGSKGPEAPVPIEPQICQATCAIMKLSFDEEYRRAMNELGGLQAVAELLQVDYEMHRMTSDPLNLALRRYAGMALTNLTFGDVNKAAICVVEGALGFLVSTLTYKCQSNSLAIIESGGGILRNVSRQDEMSCGQQGHARVLLGVPPGSSHVCSLLPPARGTAGLEPWEKGGDAGSMGRPPSPWGHRDMGVLSGCGLAPRSSLAMGLTAGLSRRQVLRDHNCLQTLLQHLRSHSLTIVSNACGTLWNLSARSPKDQELLWDLGAVSMLRNLIHSKHKMIAMGSAAALRNLLTNRPPKYKDTSVISPGSCMPSLYVRKQKALEAELDAKHLAETFDTMEKQSLKSQSAKKPLRHMESLVKDYASDSGCFDDDEVPNVSSGVEAANASVLSMFLNSSFLQGQALPRALAQRRCPEPEKDTGSKLAEPKKPPLPEDDVSLAAEKLANKISSTVAKIDKLVEDISTMHTSSDDSFSLSSEDHCLDWQYGAEEAREARAQSCSPCRLSDTSGFAKRENLNRARALLRLKTAYTSLSNDSLNSGSTSDGYCTKEHMKPCTRAPFLDYREELQHYQKRPSRLDLKNILSSKPERIEPPVPKAKDQAEPDKLEQGDLPERAKKTVTFPSPKALDKEPEWKKEAGSKLPSDPQVHTIKLSPSYQHIPLLENLAKSSSTASAGGLASAGHHPSLLGRKQAWLPPALLQTADTLSKIPEKLAAHPPATAEQELVQKYSVEDTPICFSRCSSLSSLSSADNVLDGQSHSENDIDSDSSLEIIEMEEGNGEPEDGRQQKEKAVDRGPTTPGGISKPISIPFPKRDKVFLRETSPSRHEDLTPSSSSENYIQETPLVMSRCSSVSSLGSFESPSIASSIQSDPCSEMFSGTISPSELPDSPGQTMPPSRSKTPLFELGCQPEKETSQFNIQWENNVKKFMEITDFKERFQLPQDLDSMVYFTVEKPNENFSCASSLSALPLHEHYVQKDVELKLMPTFPEKNSLNFVAHEKREERREERFLEARRRADHVEPNSDDDIEILKECINSAMPSRFCKVKTSLLSGQVLHPHTKKAVHVPVYMLVPASSHPGVPRHLQVAARDPFKDDDSCTDSADGTPVNFSSAASLSDETLRYPAKEEPKQPQGPPKRMERREAASGQRSQAEGQREPGKRSSSGSSAQSRGGSACKPPTRDGVKAKRGQEPSRSSGSLERDTRQKDGAPEGDVAFQSLCHTTPTEEAIYCFYECDSDEAPDVVGGRARPGQSLRTERRGSPVCRPEPDTSNQPVPGKAKAVTKMQHNLIADETPPCYSLSSSMSSLSDANLSAGEGWVQPHSKVAQARAVLGLARSSSPSSLSLHSEDNLLQKCIGSVMPKRRRPSVHRRATERKTKLKGSSTKSLGSRKAEGQHHPAEDAGSDRGSDLDSVEWKAIQEGANSIVTWLHQAAASLSREASSESDSILSFMSGLSVGSTLQLSLERKEKKQARGPEANKRERTKGIPPGKKAMEPRAVGGRSAGTSRSPAPQKPVPNLPVVFRGRTVIYMPSLAKDAASLRSTPKKTATAAAKAEMTAKNLSLSQQRSRSLHRLGKASELGELALPKRSTTPPARMGKGPPSSGSSRTSTPSQPAGKKLPSPSQLAKLGPPPAGKVGGTSSPPGRAAAPKSPAPKQPKTQKSPVRIPFMQKPSKKALPARGALPALEEHTGSIKACGGGTGGRAGPAGRQMELERVASAHARSSDTERSGFLRQLTFIKESSSLLLRHHTELPPVPGPAQPRSRAALPAVFLCSSRCDELKAAKGVLRPGSLSTQGQSGAKAPRRTSSQSPSRLPVKSSGIGTPEPFKRYSSSPNISVARRASSPSSVRSATSEATAPRRARQPLEPPTAPKAPTAMMKGTWRRIRDEDIPHILKSTLPSSALPLASATEEEEEEEAVPSAGTPRKTSDAVVQTEDFATAKTNSSTSPTLESRVGPERGRSAGPGPGKGALPIFRHEPTGSSSFPGSRHGSPSRAARVSPFNYVPSPMAMPAAADKAVEKIPA
uniref:APC regulator of WNT signaling pathway 2 n=1 Tax=Nothoprocta perdicaria TaxID=30464 RepID=A0A8C6YP99_NOTPE